MKKRLYLFLCLAVLAAVVLTAVIFWSGRSSTRPRLILVIVVDQFRYDYLERFHDQFGSNGFRRLQREGASWLNANYDHAPTYTAPGHAAIMTGTWPAQNGIVANDWYDREVGESVTSVSDGKGVLLGGGPGEKASSPRRLQASTLGDELRMTTNNRSKVIGISIKDRSAILPAGRHANAAYWFSTQSGQMVSSNYYFSQLPDWVTKYNESRPADKFFGAVWERLLPEDIYLKNAGSDAPLWEAIGTVKDKNTFPHTINGGAAQAGMDFYGELDFSPFSNDMLLDFAEQAITNENLGGGTDTDVLTLSFSANDYIGHRYGPYSQEVMDITLRTDQQIAKLLNFVDSRVGLNNTLIVFTADHGVAPIPEQATSMKLDGGRISGTSVLQAVRSAISAHYGKDKDGKDKDPQVLNSYVLAFVNGNVYFNLPALEKDGINLDEISWVAGQAALSIPGISKYYTRAQLTEMNPSAVDPIERRIIHGFYSPRSGDMFILYEPYKYLLDGSATATHGSPYLYDTHVPVIIRGTGIKQGEYDEAMSPADIAPTLSTLLHVQPPSNATGRTLREALVSDQR